jgi:uncharacterized protein YprB with RNaseH-like and TPR domain
MPRTTGGPMLQRTFVHIPGVSYATEQKLWNAGVTCWDDCAGDCFSGAFPAQLVERIRKHLGSSRSALDQHDGAYFARRMQNVDIWRLYPEFSERAVFLDIETTGLFTAGGRGADVTVVALFDGRGTRALVRGRDLHDFPDIIREYPLIITYNGTQFDLPFLHRSFPKFREHYAHIDLRFPLYRFGLRGGLKGIERQVGIEREGALSGLDGFLAVKLWQEHLRGTATAIDTLVRYSLEDVVNLQYLMEFTYNRSIKDLPVNVPKLCHETPPRIDVPFDEELILRLKQRYPFR